MPDHIRWLLDTHPTRAGRCQWTFLFPYPVSGQMDKQLQLGRRHVCFKYVPDHMDYATMVRTAFTQVVSDHGIPWNRTSRNCNARATLKWATDVISTVMLVEPPVEEEGDDGDQYPVPYAQAPQHPEPPAPDMPIPDELVDDLPPYLVPVEEAMVAYSPLSPEPPIPFPDMPFGVPSIIQDGVSLQEEINREAYPVNLANPQLYDPGPMPDAPLEIECDLEPSPVGVQVLRACSVCYSALATMVAVPCGHVSTCEVCAKTLGDTSMCSMCRDPCKYVKPYYT